MLDEFSKVSGLKLNEKKTEALWAQLESHAVNSIGQFQKISIHHDGWHFGILRARGGRGSLNWNSEGMGEYLQLEF